MRHPTRSTRFQWSIARLLLNKQGSALVEFALVGPLFIFLLLGIFDFGRAIWFYNTAAHAAKEGARYAIVRGADSGRTASESNIIDYVKSRATGMTEVTVTPEWIPDKKPGSEVKVQVDIPFRSVLPLLPNLTLTSTSRMVISI